MKVQVRPIIASVVLPAGTYIVGDPCYHVHDESWSGLLEFADYFGGCTCLGYFKKADRGAESGDEYGTVVAFSTAYGDGSYHDQSGREYGVDSGTIGIIPKCDVAEFDPVKFPACGHRIVFSEPFSCWEEDGTIHFGDVAIVTGQCRSGPSGDDD